MREKKSNFPFLYLLITSSQCLCIWSVTSTCGYHINYLWICLCDGKADSYWGFPILILLIKIQDTLKVSCTRYKNFKRINTNWEKYKLKQINKIY